MIQNKNTPQLRFPEFEEKWERIPLIELSENGFSNGAFNDPRKVGRGYRIINVKDMYIDGTINIDNLTRVEIDEKEFSKNKVIFGDIFFTRSSLVKEGIAYSNVNLTYAEDLTFDGHLIRMRPKKEKYSPIFLYYNFATSKARIQFIQKGKTTTMTTIGQEDIATVEISLPTLPEQTRIASFLTSVDNRLAQLRQKKTLLEEYKKGVMQKIFDVKADGHPSLRFKDENGNDFPKWEVKKLGEILTIGSGRDYKHLGSGNIPVFGTGGYMTSVNDFLYDGETVCIGRKGTIDSPMFYKGKIWTVDTLFYTHSFKNSIPKFVFYVFQTINWKEYNEASGVPSLSKSTIEKILMPILSLSEQTLIANFLSAIDKKINHTQSQLTQTQQWKKGLLQKMFV
jgi:type I restriction enzyme S subunit